MGLEKFANRPLVEKDARPKRPALSTLIDLFHSDEEDTTFAYTQALNALHRLDDGSNDTRQFLYFLISDIVFAALHTTLFEEVLVTLPDHKDVAIPLINKFGEGTQERDELINEHTRNHIRFLENGGQCEGCDSCEGHPDVAHLLPHFLKADVDYFVKLYLEVQTIYCSLERLLYEFLPANRHFMNELSLDLINQYRTYIAHYVTRRLTNV